jgi:LysR family transcriptional regulator, transcriptional activator for bauABCD operon
MMNQNRLPNITDHDIMLLKVFDAVVKAGSFTGAEICLNKSKSAISIHISSLETRLGQTLCRRGRSGFSLTPEGEQIYEVCKDLFSDLDRFRDRVSRVTSLHGGTLSVAVDDGMFGRHEVVAEAVKNFKNSCPDVFLNLYVTSPERILQMLVETTVDIGVCSFAREIPGTDLHPLVEEETALYCGSGHPLAGIPDADITAEMLADCEFVDLASYPDLETEHAVSQLKMKARSPQASARLLLILTDKMIGLLPRPFAAGWVADGRLKELPSQDFATTHKSYALVRRDVAGSKVCNQLLKELTLAFRAAHSQSAIVRDIRSAPKRGVERAPNIEPIHLTA